MSLNKSATRRVSLLAGSSLIAASLATFAFTGVILAPTSALAANECAPIGVAPSANGPVADTYACTGATLYQGTGITYSSQGNLTVNSTGAMDVGAVGINLTGNNADTVTFTANNTLTGTSGAVLDVTSASGAIAVTMGRVTATAAGTTHGARIESTGGGNITLTKTGNDIINNVSTTSEAALFVATNGGNITMTVPSGSALNGVRGRLYGIRAQTSGSGALVLNMIGAAGAQASATEGIAGVDVAAGTGGITMNLLTARGGAGVGILANTTGALNITIGAPISGSGVTGHEAAIVGMAGAGATLTNNATIGVVGNGGLQSGPPASQGTVDLSGVTGGGVTFLNIGAGRWVTNGANALSNQNDLLEMSGTGQNWFGAGASVAFGGGTDTFNMTGTLIAEGVTITNLEAFNNSGLLYLGAENTGAQTFINDTDRLPDDYLSMAGATFTGSGGSHLFLDVALGGVAQVGCETFTGTADCLDLRGGATAGSTLLTINDATPGGMLPGYVPQGITVIDVAGGTSSAAHFTLDPASTSGYVHPLYGPAFDRPGAFVYVFRYDEDNQRFILVGQPRDGSLFEYGILSGAAQSIWHMTSETVTSRQTDLRNGMEGGSVWLRTSGEVTRRDASQTFEGFDGPVVFDNSYNLYAGTIMGGMDLFTGSSGVFDYAAGVQIGYVSSSFDMDEGEASGRFTGATGGVYGSLWSDSFFVDGAFNLNGLALNYESPALGSKTNTYVNSVGAHAEAGIRARLTERAFAEPLLTVSYVRTSFEEISLSAGEVQPADAESLRGALGMRLGATLAGESVSATYFVTGRAWNEFEGESSGVVHNPGVDLPFGDELTGAFGEAELGVNIFNSANTFSGFAVTGVKWKEGYSAVDLSLGVRMAW